MKLLLQSWCVLLLISIIWIQTGLARSRRNPACNEEQQNKMNKEFQECLNKFTKEHHESTGKASSAEDYQKFTCKLLQDTVDCGSLWKRCHAPSEVRSIQDTHIQARISQFRDNNDGIDVFKCPVVEEYISSGRADQVDQSTEGACTVSEVSEVQRDFSTCSHKLSLKLYEEVQTLEEKRYARATNDLNAELDREDQESATLDPIKDIKPKLCSTLNNIGKQCIEAFKKCFSKEDADQIQRQHLNQMLTYYAKIYPGVGNLTDCPGLAFLNKDYEDYNEISDDYDEDDYDYDDDEDYSEYNNYNVDSEVTTTRTETEQQPPTPKFSSHQSGSSIPDPESGSVIAEPKSISGSIATSINSQTIHLYFVLCCILLNNPAWLLR